VIVRFFRRGRGGGKGPTQYLLGRDGQREGATLLRGDPELVSDLIDASRFARRYTSGCLSFAEADLPPGAAQAMMSEFEKVLMPGLEPRQYACLWVEHRDKGRVELNFLIPNTELLTGKRLQPYYHAADMRRVDAWATIQRDRWGLADPNQPERRQALVTPRDLPRDRQAAADAITAGLLAQADQGHIKDRAGVLEALHGAGFKVGRVTKSSISIEPPEGGQNLRLKGALYDENFRAGDQLRAAIEEAGQRYRAGHSERLAGARATLEEGLRIKRQENHRRHPADRAVDAPAPKAPAPPHVRSMAAAHSPCWSCSAACWSGCGGQAARW